jgi:hypothetical protein
MTEHHDLTGSATGAPLPSGRTGASVRLPLDSPPSPRWSEAFSARLMRELVGCPAVAHLRLDHVVQGADIVLDGVEDTQATALGAALRAAVEGANGACDRDEAPESQNMDPALAETVARRVAGALAQSR